MDAVENKVEFGLSNAHYAIVTVDEETNALTFGTPERLPGAVSLTLDANGDLIQFKADDIDYYTNPNNQGYNGTLTLARVPDKFKQDVLGEEKTKSGVMIESADAQTNRFALMYEFQGDKKRTRHVMYYCSANRPSIASTTKDSGEPNTTDLSIIVSPRPDNNVVKAKTTAGVTTAVYDAWYTKVYEKADEAAGA
jgi:phi13 family phage major tail protein|nr:MAG TPA: tail tube protein [Caudoviricetes sp.]